MNPIRVGVVGAGGMGVFHARTLASFHGVQIVGIADPRQEARDALAAELGSTAFDDPFALIADDDIDAVVIASPDHTHVDLAVAALRHDRWILCEKPLATDAAGARSVIEAEVALGERRIQLGFMREYDPVHRQLVAELPRIGEIQVIKAVHRNTVSTRRTTPQLIGQSMVHEFHSLRFVTGDEVVAVQAFGSGAEGDWHRHLLAVCRMSSGAHAIVEFDDTGFAYEVRFEVLGTLGDLVTTVPTVIERRRAGGVEAFIGDDWFGRFAEAYRLQDLAWIDSIRQGRATGPDCWDGWRAQAIVDATLHSLLTGRSELVAAAPRPALYSPEV